MIEADKGSFLCSEGHFCFTGEKQGHPALLIAGQGPGKLPNPIHRTDQTHRQDHPHTLLIVPVLGKLPLDPGGRNLQGIALGDGVRLVQKLIHRPAKGLAVLDGQPFFPVDEVAQEPKAPLFFEPQVPQGQPQLLQHRLCQAGGNFCGAFLFLCRQSSFPSFLF